MKHLILAFVAVAWATTADAAVIFQVAGTQARASASVGAPNLDSPVTIEESLGEDFQLALSLPAAGLFAETHPDAAIVSRGATQVEAASDQHADLILSDSANGTFNAFGSTSQEIFTPDHFALTTGYSMMFYMFSVSTESTLTLTYLNSQSGLFAFDDFASLSSSAGTITHRPAANGSGLLTFALQSGTDYTFRIQTTDSLFTLSESVGSMSSQRDRRYAFNIASVGVPEPHAWLLMLAGLGLAGWRLRSRRSRATALEGPPIVA